MMSLTAVLRRLRSIAPVATITIGVATLVACVLIAKANNIYLSGLYWPYFSDTGRDPPAYYVFCVGLSVVAILTGVCWHNNYDFQMMAMKQSSPNGEIPKKLARLAGTTRIAGLISIIGLPILAFMDVASHPVVHRYGACWFFGWEWFAVCVNTYVSKKLASAPLPPTTEDVYASMENQAGDAFVTVENRTAGATVTATEQERIKISRKRTYTAQIACAVVFFLGLIPYLPVGAMLPYCDRLTISRCLEMDLGQSYCTKRMRLDDTETLIYACEDNFWNAQIPAFGQLACILCLIGYTVTFAFHVYQDEMPATAPATPVDGKDVE